MGSAIWFMEGLSCQKDILSAVKKVRVSAGFDFTLIASHRKFRSEILNEADFSYIEPKDEDERLAFIRQVVSAHNVSALHTVRHSTWFEQNRNEIESLGVKLTTGALSVATFELAEDKFAFSQQMNLQGLPVVESELFTTVDELSRLLTRYHDRNPLSGTLPCIKPVQGIYGMGFWTLDKNASLMSCFDNPDNRRVHPDTFINAMKAAEDAGAAVKPMLLMPYLPGPERSVDMVVENGKVLAAVSRCKTSEGQVFEQQGEAWDLALACAELINADGLINVQTRDSAEGKPYLLETNLRPSGGVGYTLHSGINLPGLFALRQLGIVTYEVAAATAHSFRSVTVKPTHAVQPVPQSLPTLLNASSLPEVK